MHKSVLRVLKIPFPRSCDGIIVEYSRVFGLSKVKKWRKKIQNRIAFLRGYGYCRDPIFAQVVVSSAAEGAVSLVTGGSAPPSELVSAGGGGAFTRLIPGLPGLFGGAILGDSSPGAGDSLSGSVVPLVVGLESAAAGDTAGFGSGVGLEAGLGSGVGALVSRVGLTAGLGDPGVGVSRTFGSGLAGGFGSGVTGF